jgi:hypothetical protein
VVVGGREKTTHSQSVLVRLERQRVATIHEPVGEWIGAGVGTHLLEPDDLVRSPDEASAAEESATCPGRRLRPRKARTRR